VRIAVAGIAVASLAAFSIGFGHWPAAAVPVLFGVMGFGAGIAGPSRDLLVKQATPPGATGRVYGVVYSGLDVGMTIAPLIFGALMDAGRFQGVWAGIGLLLLVLIGTAVNVRRNARPVTVAA
jgi:MFS family permease